MNTWCIKKSYAMGFVAASACLLIKGSDGTQRVGQKLPREGATLTIVSQNGEGCVGACAYISASAEKSLTTREVRALGVRRVAGNEGQVSCPEFLGYKVQIVVEYHNLVKEWSGVLWPPVTLTIMQRETVGLQCVSQEGKKLEGCTVVRVSDRDKRVTRLGRTDKDGMLLVGDQFSFEGNDKFWIVGLGIGQGIGQLDVAAQVRAESLAGQVTRITVPEVQMVNLNVAAGEAGPRLKGNWHVEFLGKQAGAWDSEVTNPEGTLIVPVALGEWNVQAYLEMGGRPMEEGALFRGTVQNGDVKGKPLEVLLKPAQDMRWVRGLARCGSATLVGARLDIVCRKKNGGVVWSVYADVGLSGEWVAPIWEDALARDKREESALEIEALGADQMLYYAPPLSPGSDADIDLKDVTLEKWPVLGNVRVVSDNGYGVETLRVKVVDGPAESVWDHNGKPLRCIKRASGLFTIYHPKQAALPGEAHLEIEAPGHVAARTSPRELERRGDIALVRVCGIKATHKNEVVWFLTDAAGSEMREVVLRSNLQGKEVGWRGLAPGVYKIVEERGPKERVVIEESVTCEPGAWKEVVRR